MAVHDFSIKNSIPLYALAQVGDPARAQKVQTFPDLPNYITVPRYESHNKELLP